MRGTDQFAGVSALRPALRPKMPAPHASEAGAEGGRLAEILGASVQRNHFGEHLSVRNWYATPEICAIHKDSLDLLLPHAANDEICRETAADPGQWLFLDTETTGLAGGTGTYAFLVGIAWWDCGGLQVEQFFMRDLDEEHSVLLELSARMRERPLLVTFNGKSFDWPLLETRYRMTRSILPFAPKVHLDLLHPARQLWRLKLGSVRLRDLERHVLANGGRALDWSRDDDIDSSLIPQIYFDFLRGGPAQPLAGIFRHNQMDLRGLAALAGRILALLDQGSSVPGDEETRWRDAIEALGLSRLLRRRGHSARAREMYETALCAGLPHPAKRLAQSELAQLAKRDHDYARAIPLWEVLRQMPETRRGRLALPARGEAQKTAESAVEAAEQLAIYYEHRANQPSRALELVRAAIAELRHASRAGGVDRDRAAGVEVRLVHRLARLERRCAGTSLFLPRSATGFPGRGR